MADAAMRTEADDNASHELRLSGRFLYRLLCSPVVPGEESDYYGKNDTGYESEDPRRSQYLLQTAIQEDNTIEEIRTQLDECESIIPCFSMSIDEQGGIATSGSIALLVPPYSIPKPTQFEFDLRLPTTAMPALPRPEKNHFLLSPILSLSPHDAKFQQNVAIRFPFTASSKGWLLRLVYCPLNGEHWESLVDVLVPHNMSASSLLIMARDGSMYDPDTNMISVDHFCYKCWVGVPIRHNVKKRIWCSLFGRPLGSRGTWEIIVRCFEPYIEVYRLVADMMEAYGAEPLIEGPEPLEIGKRGVVRVALQNGQISWRLDVNCRKEYIISAKSTFWEGDAESLLGYRCKFIVKPEDETEYVHVVASVSYIDDVLKQSRSIQLDGTAPVCGRSPRRHKGSNLSHSSVFNITNCSDLNVGSDNKFIGRRATAWCDDQAYPVEDKERGDDYDSCGVVSRSASVIKAKPRTSKANGRNTPESLRGQQFEPQIECGQHESELFFSFPREGGKLAPHRCTIQYLGCRDIALTKSSQGTRMPDPFVVRTCKPGWPYPDTVSVLITDEKGCTVGHCRLSLGASNLTVTGSVTLTPVTSAELDSDTDEEDIQGSVGHDIDNLHVSDSNGKADERRCCAGNHLCEGRTRTDFEATTNAVPIRLQNIPRASDLNCGSDAATLLLKLVSLHKLSDQQAISLALEYDPSSSTRRNPKELAKDLMRRGLISAEDAIDVTWDLRQSPINDASLASGPVRSDCGPRRSKTLPSLIRKFTRQHSGMTDPRRWSETSSQDVGRHQERKTRRQRSTDVSEEIRERLYTNRSIESTTDSLNWESTSRLSVASEASVHRLAASVIIDKNLKSE